jgi:hypothetical protein
MDMLISSSILPGAYLPGRAYANKKAEKYRVNSMPGKEKGLN